MFRKSIRVFFQVKNKEIEPKDEEMKRLLFELEIKGIRFDLCNTMFSSSANIIREVIKISKKRKLL